TRSRRARAPPPVRSRRSSRSSALSAARAAKLATRRGTGVRALAPADADPGDPTRGVADDERVRRYVASDDRARTDHRVPADLEVRQHDGAGADRRPAPHGRVAELPVGGGLERAVRVRRARPPVVREDHVRANEHAVLHRQPFEERGVVLDLAPVADHDARAHVDALADVALAADARALADLGVMPHPRSGRDASVARDHGGIGDRCRTRLRLRRRHARTASGRYTTRAPPERSERSLLGPSQERCACAIAPDGKPIMRKTTSSISGCTKQAPVAWIHAGSSSSQYSVIDTSCGPRSHRTLMSNWWSPRLTRWLSMYWTRPMPPFARISFTATTAGLYTKVWPTMSVRPAFSDARRIASASATFGASGFSTKTCLPAAKASSASVRCVPTGVAMHTASIARSAKSARWSVVVFSAGNRLRIASSRSGERSATATGSAPGASLRLRTRFGPQ